MADYLDWPGASGRMYRYWFVAEPITDTRPCNYMFVCKLPNGNVRPIYIGQAENAKNRLPCHDRLDDCKRAGATHLMAHATQGGEAARCAEERDLILQWQPTLNTQLRKLSS